MRTHKPNKGGINCYDYTASLDIIWDIVFYHGHGYHTQGMGRGMEMSLCMGMGMPTILGMPNAKSAFDECATAYCPCPGFL